MTAVNKIWFYIAARPFTNFPDVLDNKLSHVGIMHLNAKKILVYNSALFLFRGT